ncbi:MAG: glycosyltransferase [Mesorhizobium sp.]
MNYYVLPGIGIYGGIKVGFQFAQLLTEAGVPIAVATPGSLAPSWFRCAQPVADRQQIVASVGKSDTLIFSLPHDYPELKATGSRLIFHCQGTDPLINPILHDRDVTVLTCWEQAKNYAMIVARRDAIDVGISISDVFFHDGSPKDEQCAAFMPRRGAAIAQCAMKHVRSLRFLPIDGSSEDICANSLKRSGFFLGTAVAEGFGLPALEAMAAGCVVVSVPVVGGMEYLRHGHTACVAEPKELPAALAEISQQGAGLRRAALRDRGAAMASRYRIAIQRGKLRAAMEAGLKDALSWI